LELLQSIGELVAVDAWFEQESRSAPAAVLLDAIRSTILDTQAAADDHCGCINVGRTGSFEQATGTPSAHSGF
jgi:hypothetical protein